MRPTRSTLPSARTVGARGTGTGSTWPGIGIRFGAVCMVAHIGEDAAFFQFPARNRGGALFGPDSPVLKWGEVDKVDATEAQISPPVRPAFDAAEEGMRVVIPPACQKKFSYVRIQGLDAGLWVSPGRRNSGQWSCWAKAEAGASRRGSTCSYARVGCRVSVGSSGAASVYNRASTVSAT